MDLEYSSRKQGKILSDPALIARHYGHCANALINRLSELRSVKCLDSIPTAPPPRRHKLEGFKNSWAIDLTKNYRIIIEPQGEYDPQDLKTITRIKIIDIVDYH